jgi:hypothetical protein
MHPSHEAPADYTQGGMQARSEVEALRDIAGKILGYGKVVSEDLRIEQGGCCGGWLQEP